MSSKVLRMQLQEAPLVREDPTVVFIHKPRDTEFGVVFVTENSAKILNAKASLDFQTLG